MISQGTAFNNPITALLLTAVFLLFSGCSINLTTIGNEKGVSTSEAPFFSNMTLFHNGKALALSKSLQNEYSKAINVNAYPSSSCYGTANIQTSVKGADKVPGDAWYIATAFIPIFPIKPVNEDWTYRFSAKIYCENMLVHQYEFIESEHVEAFWFGALRSDLVNEASATMHKKLIERLKFEMNEKRQTDFNAISG